MKLGQTLAILGLALASCSESEKELPEFEVIFPKPTTDQIEIQPGLAKSIVELSSEFGIGKCTLRLVKGNWPEALVFRLHLRGLEGFELTTGEKRLERYDLNVKAYDKNQTLFAGKYLLDQAGYYQVVVPVSLLDTASKQIEVHWVDFYR